MLRNQLELIMLLSLEIKTLIQGIRTLILEIRTLILEIKTLIQGIKILVVDNHRNQLELIMLRNQLDIILQVVAILLELIMHHNQLDFTILDSLELRIQIQEMRM